MAPRDLACLSQLRRMARYSMCAQTIQGNPDSRVSSLVWCASSKSNPSGRLFSSSIDGSISEWDLFSLKQKKQRLETRIFSSFGVDQPRSLSAHCSLKLISLLFSAKISSSQKCPREVKHMSRLDGQTCKVDRIQEGEK